MVLTRLSDSYKNIHNKIFDLKSLNFIGNFKFPYYNNSTSKIKVIVILEVYSYFVYKKEQIEIEIENQSKEIMKKRLLTINNFYSNDLNIVIYASSFVEIFYSSGFNRNISNKENLIYNLNPDYGYKCEVEKDCSNNGKCKNIIEFYLEKCNCDQGIFINIKLN